MLEAQPNRLPHQLQVDYDDGRDDTDKPDDTLESQSLLAASALLVDPPIPPPRVAAKPNATNAPHPDTRRQPPSSPPAGQPSSPPRSPTVPTVPTVPTSPTTATESATKTTEATEADDGDMAPSNAASVFHSMSSSSLVALDLPTSNSHTGAFSKQGKVRPSPSSSSLPLSGLMPPQPVSQHAFKTALWVSLALMVALGLLLFVGRQPAIEFLSAYIVEYSLSVDNLFVFLLIFRYFKVPREAQQSVLSYGILGAMLLRGVFIVCGTALVHRFQWIALLFAALLLYSAVRLLLEDDDDDANLDDNRIIRLSKALIPVSDRYSGERFFVRDNARLLATPLMVVLVSIELSDIIFALDSVPAVLALSSNTFVIYTSNILAVMGLRSLFFVLSVSIGNLRFLKQALAVVLAFIAVKMVAGFFHLDFGTLFSLAFVTCSIGAGVILSIVFPLPPTARSPPPVGTPPNQVLVNNV